MLENAVLSSSKNSAVSFLYKNILDIRINGYFSCMYAVFHDI